MGIFGLSGVFGRLGIVGGLGFGYDPVAVVVGDFLRNRKDVKVF